MIWFGIQDIDENETSTGGILGEVALRSGGEIFRITEESLGNGDVGLVRISIFKQRQTEFSFNIEHISILGYAFLAE